MKRTTKTLAITASLLVTVGIALFVVAMSLLGWDFNALSTFKYVENRYEITEEFRDISVVSDTANIVLLPSENGKPSVVCYTQEKIGYKVSVDDQKLSITPQDDRKWYEYIGIGFETSKIAVYLPPEAYGRLTVKSNTSDLEISENFTFESIDVALSTGNVTANSVTCKGDVKIDLSTGNVTLADVSCKNLISTGSTGNLSLKKVVASEKFSLNRSTGSITLEDSDAAELTIRTDTGDVTGSLLSSKIFVANTDTGIVSVPETETGGKCSVFTSTGDISIWLEE